ncbi:M14 family metallopeptidase [Leeuwenhoekiella marinoflava]|uniref:Succinylglutamate desuccinylase/Aspartoacylase catalytic domain-containing protein n=2 Tax=Leeuwenhoekiella marinoflava TaxID=988 RepID=A0A4Q0P4I1_9FLAO|nr:M14 family metallopeptidase [Leeuwenhoekiella marinoflava]RXG21008.1 hypothetical protein DSL99_4064 [Leeuwenhoekiella marinoflava]SHG05744.1 hypothetical protein SAMN02745246_04089 [Leeuwenhoekiella marinoflava DSM 3653]
MKNIVFLVILIFTQYSFAQTFFSFEGKEVAAGTKAHFKIPVEHEGVSTFIPVTIFNGATAGETLGITAGIHGYEYPPILGAQRLIQSINPKELTGTVILVQLANVKSFLGRSPYVNPADGKNLNRSFPGKEEGSISEQIAYFISNNIINRVDYFLDMHAGDAPEDLMRYGAYYNNATMPEISATGKEMALALGFNHIVTFNTEGKDYMKAEKPSLYTSAEAFKRGIPAIDIECGRLGIPEAEAVDQVEQAVLLLLQKLNFTSKLKVLSTTPAILIKNRIYTDSTVDGIFYPLKKAGDYVVTGMKLGYTTDFFGNIQETIYAKADGLLLLILGTPPVNKGETVAVIGLIRN